MQSTQQSLINDRLEGGYSNASISQEDTKVADQVRTESALREQEEGNEEDDAPLPEAFISTTAGGDGLEFDQRLSSIFDEIQMIKGDGSVAKKRTIKNDDEGLTLDQVAE